jgi:hypothetical protein
MTCCSLSQVCVNLKAELCNSSEAYMACHTREAVIVCVTAEEVRGGMACGMHGFSWTTLVDRMFRILNITRASSHDHVAYTWATLDPRKEGGSRRTRHRVMVHAKLGWKVVGFQRRACCR